MIDSKNKFKVKKNEYDLIINILISRHFLKFLRKNKAFKPYLTNLKKGYFYRLFNSYGFFIKTFIKKCVNKDPKTLISNGFFWKETKEGYEYWRKLQCKWEEEYINYYKKIK